MHGWFRRSLFGLLSLAIQAAATLWALWMVLLIGVEYDLRFCLFLLLTGVVAFFVLIFAHELGHLLAAVALGFPIGRFTVGFFTVVREGQRFRIRLNTDWFGLAAYVYHRLPEGRPSRLGQAIVIAAGPSLNLVLGLGFLLLAAWVNPGPPPDTRDRAWSHVALLYPGDLLTAQLNFAGLISIYLASCLLPATSGRFRNDGQLLLDLWRGPKPVTVDQALADCHRAIRLDPTYAPWYLRRGWLWFQKMEYEKALADFEQAVRLDPDCAAESYYEAWVRQTLRMDGYCDGVRAVEAVRRVCEITNWAKPGYLEVLAAAYATAGQFEPAVQYQEKALADSAYPAARRQAGNHLLDLYRQGNPPWISLTYCHDSTELDRLIQKEIELLLRLLRDEAPEVRAEAATNLGQLGGRARAALAPLFEALKDPDETVRDRAAKALKAIDPSWKGELLSNQSLPPQGSVASPSQLPTNPSVTDEEARSERVGGESGG
jgi:tetratricopeptide (TPR) repeat protein